MAYTAQFGYPLRGDEIVVRLLSNKAINVLDTEYGFTIGDSSVNKKPIKTAQSRLSQSCSTQSWSQILSELELLLQEGVIICSQKKPSKTAFFALANHSQDFRQREKRTQIARERRAEIATIAQTLSLVSGVVGVAVTGSLAMQNSPSTADDIDLCVITQKNRLWLTRFRILISSVKNGTKGLPWSKKKDDWCFNLWFSQDSLAIPDEKRDIYTAYELCQTQWIIDTQDISKQYISQQFFAENTWVKEFLPAFWDTVSKKYQPVVKHPITQVATKHQSGILSFLNTVLFYVQKMYVHLRVGVSTHNISRSQAFLHTGNVRKTIYITWKSLVEYSTS